VSNDATERSVLAIGREFPGLVQLQHNVLLEGPSGAIDAALALLRPHLRAPIVTIRPPGRLEISNGAGTLIVEDIDALSGTDQRRMLQWMSGPGSETRVISTARRRLFALVDDGRFDAALYYRLNTLLIREESPDGARSAREMRRVVQHDAQQRAVDIEPAVVFDESPGTA
jgi:hypothetical protein